ncbi:MAG TPA: translation initiation factor IF-3 [candidate division Zixibacteria bacterium]|nr:translation initiation factor IF-3 [candidate division Zixibacteria bacterium]
MNRSRDTLKPRVNERIRVKRVRVIGPDGKQLGIMPTAEALQRAYDMDLDLIEIAPHENPPVCKIMNYGKYLYELKKREKELKKKQVGTQLKEIRLTSRIGEHDFNVKLKKIREFLEHGYRVKVSLRFRGREITHRELGEELLRRIANQTQDLGKVDYGPKLEGQFMVIQIVPFGRKARKS